MMQHTLLITALFSCTLLYTCSSLSLQDLNTIKENIKTEFFTPDTFDDLDGVPAAVRLSFHDCVGDNGCDGCLDMEDYDNKGLEDIYNGALVAYYDTELPISPSTGNKDLTFADFIALLGVSAVEKAAGNGGATLTIEPFKIGRETANSCAGVNEGKFPIGGWGHNTTMNYFADNFGLTPQETTVLIGGAHSLGRTENMNSGYDGPWDTTPADLDTGFFEELVDGDWKQFDNAENAGLEGETRVMWIRPDSNIQGNQADLMEQDVSHVPESARRRIKRQGGPPPPPPPPPPGGNGAGPEIMLNADMSLLKEIGDGPYADDACSQSFHECPDSATSEYVFMYLRDGDLFLQDFSSAYRKMIEKVSSTDLVLEEVL